MINLTVGTPPQQVSVAIDTASADLLLPALNSSGCLPNPCPPGTFNPGDSSTSTETGLPFNPFIGLTPDFKVVGSYFNDTVKIGDAVIPEMTGKESFESTEIAGPTLPMDKLLSWYYIYRFWTY